MQKIFFCLVLLTASIQLEAQDDLLSLIDKNVEKRKNMFPMPLSLRA